MHGVKSDHCDVCMDIAFSSIEFKPKALSHGTIDWPKILTNDHTHHVYNEHLLSLTTNGIKYDEYQNAILQAGQVTAMYHKRQCEGWFHNSWLILAPLLTEQNEILHATRQYHHLPLDIQSAMQADLKRLNKHIAHAISHAKATWYADICQKIHDMQMDPRLAWEHICILTKGKAAHHTHRMTMAMHLSDGSHATNAGENMSNFGQHFQQV
jgi:hypothetical protein